ncbi:hypothetical protein NPIL_409131 [Nephila pilipes]|uniref:Uncharacterized protein n=1 Tax=Nephila pilipes TaxID=299642 RepID=A0A8X6UKN3_NEPPI|nr:hypothetical protein NPIL_409131 [Nephila pilipes]
MEKREGIRGVKMITHAKSGVLSPCFIQFTEYAPMKLKTRKSSQTVKGKVSSIYSQQGVFLTRGDPTLFWEWYNIQGVRLSVNILVPQLKDFSQPLLLLEDQIEDSC